MKTHIKERLQQHSTFRSICLQCMHFDDVEFACRVYPDGIPDTLISGEIRSCKHRMLQTGEFI